jgi:hypothetical protein
VVGATQCVSLKADEVRPSRIQRTPAESDWHNRDLAQSCDSLVRFSLRGGIETTQNLTPITKSWSTANMGIVKARG